MINFQICNFCVLKEKSSCYKNNKNEDVHILINILPIYCPYKDKLKY